MPSTMLNLVTTTALTLICAASLLLAYRRSIRPILTHYGIPLQSLPGFLTRRSRGWMEGQYRRANTAAGDDDDEEHQGLNRDTERDLEEGFRDDSDDDEDDRRRSLVEVPPTPVQEEEERFPATRI